MSHESARSLEDFDFHFNPEIPKTKIIDLATCVFVERHENVLLVGRTGVAAMTVLEQGIADQAEEARALRHRPSHVLGSVRWWATATITISSAVTLYAMVYGKRRRT